MSSIHPEADPIDPTTFAVKRWLRMSVDRLGLYPKALYLELGVDAGTWSRWTSYEHDASLPMRHLPAVLSLLDSEAREDLFDLLSTLSKSTKAPERPGAS